LSYRKPTTRSKGPAKAGAKAKPSASDAKPIKVRKGEKVAVLLSGGNPRIAKADGDAPVQAYIAAMPGWKRDLGKRLDALIVRNVPNVRKAVKWNSPFYGIEGQGWFLSFHVFTLHQGGLLPRHVAATGPARPQQAQGHALHRHPRRRRARRGADGDLGEAGRRVARLGSLADLLRLCRRPSAHEPAAKGAKGAKNPWSEQWLRRISHLKFTRSGGRCGQGWEAFTPEFNKMRQDQPMA
jgi:hypothetical protein